ncbi:hypothetical protein EV360DRAFT_55809, partial [Lentinula raphanica]
QITIVGEITQVSQQDTHFVYTLDDGTGQVQIRLWKSQEHNEDEPGIEYVEIHSIQMHTYARVVGHIRKLGNNKHVQASNIRPSTDPHEIYDHLMEVMVLMQTLAHGPPNNNSGGTDSSAYNVQTLSGNGNDLANYNHLPPLQLDIIKIILSQPEHVQDVGLHVEAIVRAVHQLRDVASESISEALEALLEAGHLYTTIDENHYRVSQ